MDMHNLLTSYPQLPDDEQHVIIELENGIITGAVYNSKVWRESQDLQESFSPIGIESHSLLDELTFNSKIVGWRSK
jgi:hypothetical protein